MRFIRGSTRLHTIAFLRDTMSHVMNSVDGMCNIKLVAAKCITKSYHFMNVESSFTTACLRELSSTAWLYLSSLFFCYFIMVFIVCPLSFSAPLFWAYLSLFQ